MAPSLRRSLHRFVPAHFHDPFGLAARLIRSGDDAARFAMVSAALGVVATPADLILQLWERGLYDRAAPPTRPMILVCGPPRSGTTLMTQVLIRNLPVAFINNLTAIFPRSPLTANRLFGRLPQNRAVEYHSYYGKSSRLSGPNDALHLWDRWLGTDRTTIPETLGEPAADAMRRFFGAFERLYRAPLVAKNNSLNATARLVAEALPTARFLCLRRDPVYLAQSLLRARRDIHGGDETPYGLADTDDPDPIESVCRQVEFHERLAEQQLAAIGQARFWIVSYEGFCADPLATVRRASVEGLGEAFRPEWGDPSLRGFEVANRRRIDLEAFERLERRLGPHRERPTP
jgi:Sulfotransferase family